MLLLGNLLIGVAQILGSLIWLMNIVIIAAVVMSWVSADPRNQIVQFIRNITEPLFSSVRQYVKPIGMIDLSPIVVLLALSLVQSVIVSTLIDYGHVLKNKARDTDIRPTALFDSNDADIKSEIIN
ncbi:MAG TPA: YggT family protein [Oligoflexia bacterium]|nr:YggT family protein [Oligoflexia bacterium]HMP48672.1 YggT family protein [Oligoflexia bacterium]